MPLFRPTRGFVPLYVLAWAGQFVAFLPFVTLLLPLKVEAVDPAGRIALLSWAALGGAAVASVANIAFGMASDRTRARRGTRRPWVAAGLCLLIANYALIWRATTPAALLVAVGAFQIALNAMFAPMLAIMADTVPDRHKGRVAGWMGVAQPIGSLASVGVTLPFLAGEGARYAALCALFAAMILPFLLLVPDRGLAPVEERDAAPPQTPPPAADLILGWAVRLLVQVAGNGLGTYGYFYFADSLRAADPAAASGTVERTVALTITGVTLSAVVLTIVAGRVSDRWRRRKPMLAAAAAMMAGGLALMAWNRGWAIATLGYGMAATGVSAFLAVHAALAMQLLPSAEHRGRDLGVLNLTNTLPAMIAPAMAVALLRGSAGYGLLFLAFAAIVVVAGLLALAIRSER